jgi:hypothetical protein
MGVDRGPADGQVVSADHEFENVKNPVETDL